MTDKQHLWQMHGSITEILTKLKLQLHPNQTQIFKTSEKVDVLGYKITKDKRWLRNENGHRFNRKLNQFAKHYKNCKLDFDDFNPSVQSWIGHAVHAETFGLRVTIFNNTLFQRGLSLF